MPLDKQAFDDTESIHRLQPPEGLATRYHRSWALFSRWCLAVDCQALPAVPLTVAQFLHAHPGTVATQRGRLTAINQAHLAEGWPAPGRATAIRQALNEHYALQHSHVSERIAQVVPRLPVWGWTSGLFGRRNAALLVLVASGLSYRKIASLTQGDVCFAGDRRTANIGGEEVAAGADPDGCPLSVLRRWTHALRLAPLPAGCALLEHHLTNQTLPQDGLDPAHADLPLFTSFDSRGYTPMNDHHMMWLKPLSATSIAHIVAGNLRDPFGGYRIKRTGPVESHIEHALPAVELTELDDTYAAGVAARTRDHLLLNDIDDLWDDFDARLADVSRLLAAALDVAESQDP